MVSSQARKEAVNYLRKKYKFSERSACEQIKTCRSSYRYKTKKTEDNALINEIKKIAKRHSYYGYRRIHAVLRKKKIIVNRKKVYRIYKMLNLAHRVKRKKRYWNISKGVQEQARFANDIWAMDFMSDSLENGNKIRILNVIDTHSRECVLIDISRHFPSERVIKCLEKIMQNRTKPNSIRLDNGPEYISKALFKWAKEKKIELYHINPGKPYENGHMESFNGKFRNECLNRNIFRSILEAKILTENWRVFYNKERPHSSLGYETPEKYAEINCSYVHKQVVNK